MKKKFFRSIIVVIILVAATMVTVTAANKILITGVKLWAYNDNIKLYNESYIKTDKMTKEVQEDFQKREQIYESEDILIRIFANMISPVKMLVVILAIIQYPAWVIFWLEFIRAITLINKRKKIKRKS